MGDGEFNILISKNESVKIIHISQSSRGASYVSGTDVACVSTCGIPQTLYICHAFSTLLSHYVLTVQ
jgi:hypothetical protein